MLSDDIKNRLIESNRVLTRAYPNTPTDHGIRGKDFLDSYAVLADKGLVWTECLKNREEAEPFIETLPVLLYWLSEGKIDNASLKPQKG